VAQGIGKVAERVARGSTSHPFGVLRTPPAGCEDAKRVRSGRRGRASTVRTRPPHDFAEPLGGGGAAGVTDHENAVAEVRGGPGGAFHGGVGGHAEEGNRVDSGAAQDLVEGAVVESADPLMGDDPVAVLWGELIDDGRAGAAVDSWAAPDRGP
jgi:hypothetical protein